jgi:hypothetical protein
MNTGACSRSKHHRHRRSEVSHRPTTRASTVSTLTRTRPEWIWSRPFERSGAPACQTRRVVVETAWSERPAEWRRWPRFESAERRFPPSRRCCLLPRYPARTRSRIRW